MRTSLRTGSGNWDTGTTNHTLGYKKKTREGGHGGFSEELAAGVAATAVARALSGANAGAKLLRPQPVKKRAPPGQRTGLSVATLPFESNCLEERHLPNKPGVPAAWVGHIAEPSMPVVTLSLGRPYHPMLSSAAAMSFSDDQGPPATTAPFSSVR